MVPRSRVRVLVLIPAVVVVGLVARRLPSWAGDVAGALLYATLVYLLLALLAPRGRPASLAACAAAIGLAVELLQATGLPAWLARLWGPARYVFGSTFVPLDLLWAVLGAVVATLTDRLTRGSPNLRRDPGPPWSAQDR